MREFFHKPQRLRNAFLAIPLTIVEVTCYDIKCLKSTRLRRSFFLTDFV